MTVRGAGLTRACSRRASRAADAYRCAGLARRALGHSGPLVTPRVVNASLAAPAPAAGRS
jgi:hypothetical protein